MQRKSAIRLAIGIVLVLFIIVVNTSTRTVALERTTSGGWLTVWANRCMDRGYELRDFRFCDAMDLSLWSGCQMRITVELPSSSLIATREHRWVGGHRAAYLNVRLREQQDSLYVEDDAKILFDFETAKFYITSPLFLWRSASGSRGAWLTDAEFQSVLRSLDGAKTAPNR
jgi:hypothetical protein